MLRPIVGPIQATTGLFFRPCIWFILIPMIAQAEEWKILGEEREDRRVRLKCPPGCEIRSGRPVYVITHGMNGTCEGDRFHLLAEQIASCISCDANVVLVDWSDASCVSWIPMLVAWSIDSIADEAYVELRDLGLRTEQATLIGESFGNYVNARIATNLGKVDHIIAMNPASEMGGYPIPDLRRCARVSWSFHTHSVFDTRQRIAHRCIVIQTAPDANDLDRHTAGIRRMISALRNGHRLIPPAELNLCKDRDRFDALWAVDGSFEPTQQMRLRPAPDTPRSRPAAIEHAAQVPQARNTDVGDRANQALVQRTLVSK